MSKKIFIVYGHHDIKKSFNASVRDTFIEEAKKLGHQIDLINLHEEKPIPFFDGSGPNDQILDYRKRLEASDVLFMISPCLLYTSPSPRDEQSSRMPSSA